MTWAHKVFSSCARGLAIVPLGGGSLAGALFFAAAALLAYEPAAWLIGAWRDPAYDASGLYVFLIAVALAVWSFTSPAIRPVRPRGRWVPLALLAISAGVRLAGQVLAVNTIGAACLVVDVAALALLAGLDKRARPLSPVWLAVVFAFSLPLERVLQRTIGYGLQHLSADGTCSVLSAFYSDLACAGTRIVLAGKDVLVDLPCSGARGLLLSLLAFAVVCAVCRPRFGQAAAGAVIVVCASGAANVLRIVVLAIGIAEPDRLGGIDVMAAPWHDLIGLVALALAAIPILIWSRRVYRAPVRICPVFKLPTAPLPARLTSDGWWLDTPPLQPSVTGRPASLVMAIAAVATALVIVNAPRRPIDLAHKPKSIAMPLVLAGHVGRPLPLTRREQAYFTQFGGAGAKAAYGPSALMVIRTSSPLRHLHTPEECLRGIGFDVRYLGARFSPLPAAVYSATAPDGRRYRIDVSFVSEQGEITTNVATAVWRWMEGRARHWTAVQRITPENLPALERARFNESVAAALELAPARRSISLQRATTRFTAEGN